MRKKLSDAGRILIGLIGRRWRWLVVALFIICVLLRLSGSSIAMWSRILEEPTRGLLLFEPQRVRADEWQIWTPAALSQARQTPPFPLQNSSIGGGRSAMIANLPIAHYTTFFRPQLWGFFVFDFERGFSWWWWCQVFGLLGAFGWLLTRLRVSGWPKTLGVLWLFFSNYTQWWFSSPVMLPTMLASWAVCVGCVFEFFESTEWRRIAIAFLSFVVCGINFTLCLYPPYQIPLIWLLVALVIGRWLECRQHGTWFVRRGALWCLSAVIVIALILVPFWLDVRETVAMVAQTQYPGNRRSTGGDLNAFQLWSGFLSFFQTAASLPSLYYYNNICEGSNFYPLWPLFFGSAVVAWLGRRCAVSPLIVSLALFALCLTIFCLLPLPRVVLQATAFNIVTGRRAVLGLGVANILLCCIWVNRQLESPLPRSAKSVLAVLWWSGLALIVAIAWSRAPTAFPDLRQPILAISAGAVVALLFIFERQRPLSLILTVVLLITTTLRVNPLMRGLAPLLRSQTFVAIDRLHAQDPSAKWVVYGQFQISELVVATGASVLSGNKILPDIDFLRRLDPTGGGERIYNRYGYVYCQVPQSLGMASASPVNEALYILWLPPDLPVLEEVGARYFVFPDSSIESQLYGFSRLYENKRGQVFIYRRM